MKLSSVPLFAVYLASCASIAQAFVGNKQRAVFKSTVKSSPLSYDIPPGMDEASIKKRADYEQPGASIRDMQNSCYEATRRAYDDGIKLMEVEFPPLALEILDSEGTGAYDVSCANFQLALRLANSFASELNVTILFPDDSEVRIVCEKVGSCGSDGQPLKNPLPGVNVGALRSNKGGLSFFGDFFMPLISNKDVTTDILSEYNADMYIFIGVSAQELVDVEQLHLVQPEKPFVFFNLKLDTLRGDLGTPAFPSKDLQYRFLSRVKPVYYLRPRAYTRSSPVPPFLVNFQGCLFRSYPGEYQSLLDTGTGKFRRVDARAIRPTLTEFKSDLERSLEEEGILAKESEGLQWARRGYAIKTWWEGEQENTSNEWRS